jgi:hypothetical protein
LLRRREPGRQRLDVPLIIDAAGAGLAKADAAPTAVR